MRLVLSTNHSSWTSRTSATAVSERTNKPSSALDEVRRHFFVAVSTFFTQWFEQDEFSGLNDWQRYNKLMEKFVS